MNNLQFSDCLKGDELSLGDLGDVMFSGLIERVESDPSFSKCNCFAINGKVREQVFARLVAPEDFVGNSNVSKEVYEKRYNILRALEDFDFDSIGTRPRFIRVVDTPADKGSYWVA